MESYALLIFVGLFSTLLVDHRTLAQNETIDYNLLTDIVLEPIQSNASFYGLNPFSVDDLAENFTVGIVNDTGVGLYDGLIYGANTIYRTADVNASRAGNEANITVSLSFRSLTYHFNYTAYTANISNEGIVHGEIANLLLTLILNANVNDTSNVRSGVVSVNVESIGPISGTLDTSDPVQIASQASDIFTATQVVIQENVNLIFEETFAENLNSAIRYQSFNLSEWE